MAPVSTAVWARRRSGCSSGARDRRRGRGRRRRRARSRLRRRSARLGRPALAAGLPPGDRRAGIQDFRRDQRHGPRPAQPNGDDDVEHPKGEDFGFGRWGVREGGRTPGRRPWRPRRPDRPPLRKPSGWMRGRSGPTARSSRAAAVGEPAGVEAGRPAGEVAPQREQLRRRAGIRRRRRSAGRAARRVGVEAQDLGRGGGAL